MTASRSTVPPGGGINGRHVLILFLAFFGVVFTVNGVFLYKALSTHTGIVSNEPYRKGLKYNERIAADDVQTALGWTSTLSVARDGTVVLQLRDRAGAAVDGLAITGTIGRPSTSRHDHGLAFVRGADGLYRAQSPPLASGSWIVGVEAHHIAQPAEPVYRSRRRIWLKP